MKPEKKRILFLCVHNSARSQMAEGFLRQLYGDRFDAYSAGLTPTQVSPYAVKVMTEVGIDISKHESKSFREFLGQDFDVVVTVCDEAKEACPFFPGAKTLLHWRFPDPSEAKGSEEEILKVFRNLRDAVKDRIMKALENGELNGTHSFYSVGGLNSSR